MSVGSLGASGSTQSTSTQGKPKMTLAQFTRQTILSNSKNQNPEPEVKVHQPDSINFIDYEA